MTEKEIQYKELVNRICDFTDEYGPKLRRHVASFQVSPIFDKDVDILFLGFNPAEGGQEANYKPEDRQLYKKRFFEGNRYPPETWAVGNGVSKRVPAHSKWNWIFNPCNDANLFQKEGLAEQVTSGNYMFFNLFFFGSPMSDDAGKLSDSPKDYSEALKKCTDFTIEIVDILKPKCVLCLSINNVFNKVKNATRSKVTKPLAGSNLSRFEHNGVVYYGMTHLQYPAMKKEYVQNIARFIKQDMKF